MSKKLFNNFYSSYIKIIIDRFFAFIVFLVISPFLLLLVVLLFAFNDKDLFFIQDRVGINGKIFKLIKLKTMNEKKNKQGQLLPDTERITKFGNFIRSYSLDELPQLINIIKGDMSFIGPRPLLVKYLPLYNERQLQRHHVKPGMSGWAQVNGRNNISWEEKFEYDVFYVENISIVLDLKILFLTIRKVIMRNNINSNKNTTMAAFTGSLKKKR